MGKDFLSPGQEYVPTLNSNLGCLIKRMPRFDEKKNTPPSHLAAVDWT